MTNIFFHKFKSKKKTNGKCIFLKYLEDKKENFDISDLKEIINLNYDLWLKEAKYIYDEIVSNFYKKNSFWLLTDSSRYILWKTKTEYNFNNYFYARAIIELSKNFEEVTVVGDNEILENYIKCFSNNNFYYFPKKKYLLFFFQY